MRNTALALVVLILLGLPLPFAGQVPWAHVAFRLAAFAALAAWAIGDRHSVARPVAIPAACVAGVGVIGLLQSLPWPAAVVGLVSPEHLALARSVDPDATWAPLSLAPELSRSFALTWLAMAALLVVAAGLGRHRRRRRWLAGSICVSALFQLGYGLTKWQSGDEAIWGESIPSGGRLRGTWANPDHFALYLEICLALAFAAAWWALRRARRGGSMESRLLLVAPPVLAWLVLFAALAFTGSRGGLVAALAATVIQGLVLAAVTRRWRWGLAGIAVAAAGLLFVATVGLEAGLGRWLETSGYEAGLAGSANERAMSGRVGAHLASVELWQRFPLTGIGLATFREGFPLTQPAWIQSTVYHAHSDWLEVLVTTGIPGMLLVIVGFGATVVAIGRAMRSAARSEDRAAALAALGALAAVALHSIMDFGLTLPASAATLAVVCGAAMGGRRGS